jgi:hypothetical protein
MSVKIDLFSNVSIQEEAGEIVGATRRVKVTLPKAGGNVFRRAYDTAGVPQPSDPLASDIPDVRVISRTISSVQGIDASNVTVFIDVEYELQRPEEDQGFPLRGGSSLQQIRTQRDRNGVAIKVEYKGEEIIAEVDVLAPQGNHTRGIRIETEDPDSVVAEWINHVNDDTWRGAAAGRWLCTSVDYEMVDREAFPKAYDFTFAFEQSSTPDGWTYTAAYKNPDGDIPGDIVDGVGIVDVAWHPSRDFEVLFV